MFIKSFLLLITVFFCCALRAENRMERVYLGECAGIYTIVFNTQNTDGRPAPLIEFIKAKRKKGKKVVASLLAFPFPCGIVGLHRIYLGCAPYVPVAYIGSFGGAFGVLPLIDFFVLVFDKDLQPYINNNKVFMWVN